MRALGLVVLVSLALFAAGCGGSQSRVGIDRARLASDSMRPGGILVSTGELHPTRTYTLRQVESVLHGLQFPRPTVRRYLGSVILSGPVDVPERLWRYMQVIVGKSASRCCPGLSVPVEYGFQLAHRRNVWIYYRHRARPWVHALLDALH
jgi:hypothetical protein